MNENQIAQLALNKLVEKTGLRGDWHPGGKDIDGKIDLYFAGNHQLFFVEVKKELRNYQLPTLFEMAGKYEPFLVIAEKIFPTLKQKLRDKKIGYLDTAGNIFVHTDNKYVWIDGQKPVEEKKKITNRAFTRTGLKTVFYLLLKGDAINMPHRKLADATGVALGNINNVIGGLKEAGFILQVNDKTMKLQNRRTLLERWIAGFRETLKPSLYVGEYKFWNKNDVTNWQNLDLHNDENVWGGEAGAEYLTDHLRPAFLTLYTTHKAELITKWKLIPTAKGDITFYKKFWKGQETGTEKIAPPLLVYADLLLADDPRCIEAAEMIYQKYLINEFERN